jgi:putative aldouronate transport system permease protein
VVGRKSFSKTNLQYTKFDRVLLFINGALLTLALLIFVFPLLNVISSSFSSAENVMGGKVFLFPKGFNIDGYKEIFSTPEIGIGYFNSIYYTVFGTAINIVITIMAAYSLSRKGLVGKGAVMAFFTFTMFFNGGMIPTFLVVKDLGLLNTRWSQLLPGAMGVFNVIIARTYFQSSIPEELYESAALDGASDNQVLFRIVLPLSKPIIAVLTLYYAVGHWNSFFSALIYLDEKRLYPLQIMLRNYLMAAMQHLNTETNENAAEAMSRYEVFKYGLIVVGSLPVIMLYPFIQKYFTKGVMIGSLKG